jgi:hypothetical protein
VPSGINLLNVPSLAEQTKRGDNNIPKGQGEEKMETREQKFKRLLKLVSEHLLEDPAFYGEDPVTLGDKMSIENITEQDYKKFKKLLEFFVRQAKKNARSGKAESPTGARGTHIKPEFKRHYNLPDDYNKISGEDFVVRFFNCGQFCTKNSTYINIGRMDIVGNFSKGFTTLKNEFVLKHNDATVYNIIIPDNIRTEIKEINKLCEERSFDELGLFDGNEPNNTLKEFLNQYVEMYVCLPRYP